MEIDKQDQFREQSLPIISQIESQEIETAYKSVVSPCFAYTSNNAIYRGRFAEIVPADQFAVVLFQDSTGGHVHAAGRSMI